MCPEGVAGRAEEELVAHLPVGEHGHGIDDVLWSHIGQCWEVLALPEALLEMPWQTIHSS